MFPNRLTFYFKCRISGDTSAFSHYDRKTRCYVINLFESKDEVTRTVIAMELAKLSRDPKVVYLMKLSSGAINNCLIGLNSALKKEEIKGKHARSTGYLDVWKAKKNPDYYSIEFEQI